jgi:hypothetical protein
MSNGCGDGYHMEGGVCVPDNAGVRGIESLSARVSYFAIRSIASYKEAEEDEIKLRIEAATSILKKALEDLEHIGYPKADSAG